jgi:phosphatidyl-myo-inositol dimannoside synthase
VRVLALVTDAYGGYGGIAQYNRDLIDAMATRVDVRSIDVVPRVAPLPVPQLQEKIRNHRARKSRLSYSLACARLGLAKAPQVIFNGHLYHGPLAAQLAKVTGARLISQLHGTEIWGDVGPRHLAPLIQSDLVLCVSRNTQRRFLSLAPGMEDKTFVLSNMVGLDFRPGDREAARHRFGLEDEKVILTVARLDRQDSYKGHDRIIRMLPDLARERDERVRYLIAGQGDDQPRLEQLARELGVENLTVFLGRVPADTLPDLYRAADVFAMPSTGEGFGIVYLEAMACGTPAIGLDAGGAADAFAEGELGWCVSAEDFPRTLRTALASPRPDPQALSDRVHARFGRQAFRKSVDAALGRLTHND